MNVSLVLGTTPKGEVKLLHMGDTDAALDLFGELKKSKGRDEKSNKLLYTDVELLVRPRPNRKARFS